MEKCVAGLGGLKSGFSEDDAKDEGDESEDDGLEPDSVTKT
jgi:hypothetical protein